LCLVAAIGLALYIARNPSANRLQDLQLTIGYGLLIIVFFLGFVILADIFTGKIDLSQLLAEQGGGASMSRFQLLVFTFVIGLSFFLIVAGTGKFPSTIPPEVMTLLGISATTYGVSKGIQATGMPGKSNPPAGNGGQGNGGGNGSGQAGGAH
jgi:hypothetical protein